MKRRSVRSAGNTFGLALVTGFLFTGLISLAEAAPTVEAPLLSSGGDVAAPPMVEGQPALPTEAGQVQARSVQSVVIYEDPNFGGRSLTLGVGGYIFTDFNHVASSIQVPPGLVAHLYEHVDAGGGYGLSVDLLEDRPDLSQVNFNDTLSYVCVFSSPTPEGYIWARASVQNGQFVAGHWERQRVGGTPVNTTAVVAPPIPPHPANAPPVSCAGGATTTSKLAAVSGITAPTTGTMALPDRYTAPTANLTAVANALQLRHKSLTTQAYIPPGLRVTQLVEISIGFYSPTGNNRITQTLSVERGNRFLYNDREGDGRPRQIHVDIALRELQPGGQYFTFSRLVDLDPLYDVTISPLKFTLQENCDLVGANEIRFSWWPPDEEHAYSDTQRRFSKNTQEKIPFTIQAFAWARSEVNTSVNLLTPGMYFEELDPTYGPSFSPTGSTFIRRKLLPGRTHTLRALLPEYDYTFHYDPEAGGPPYTFSGCLAIVEYTTTYTLRLYPYL